MRLLAYTVLCITILSGCAGSLPTATTHTTGDAAQAFDDFQKPIIQYIHIPATIRNGIYIPDHYEYVTVKPGGYIVLNNNEQPEAPKQKAEQPKAKVIAPSSGGDVVIISYKVNMEIPADVILQKDKDPYLFKEPVAYYRLYAKEPVRIGKSVYAFSVKGETFNIFMVKGGKVISKSLQMDEAYLTNDGYLLKLSDKGDMK